MEAVDGFHIERLRPSRRLGHRIEGYAVIDPAGGVALEHEVGEWGQEYVSGIEGAEKGAIFPQVLRRDASDQEVSFQASSSPGLVRLSVAVSQRDVCCIAEALITVTDSLDAAVGSSVVNTRGLPGYTFERAAGELWRSRFDAERNLIVVNNGHRDFVFATRSRALQLRYLVRLYVKELVLRNFAGLPAEQLAERMIELSLYVEEKLKPT